MKNFESFDHLMTGRSEIDEAHKKLLGMIGKMRDCQSNCDEKGCSEAFTDYIDEFGKHYKWELGLVQELNSDAAFRYIEISIKCAEELNAIKSTCKKKKCRRILCLVDILSNLQSHIFNNYKDFTALEVKS